MEQQRAVPAVQGGAGRVRVHNFTLSVDGFGTGEGQSLEAPFGHAPHLMSWLLRTRTFNAMIGRPGEGEMGIDDDFAARWGPGIGAEIMGRNKFGPQRGEWPDDGWTGWWGDEPPFRTPCFVLTHHPRPPIEMRGGTTFYFIDASPQEALAEARAHAGGRDVRIGGGPSTVREFLAADLVDYAHLAVAPIILGRGERLFDGLEGLEQRYRVRSTSSPSGVTHLELERRPPEAHP